MDITVNKNSNNTHARVEVQLDNFKYASRVDAFATTPLFDDSEPVKAEVNWAALGSVSPAQARAYANAILKAADVAEEMVKSQGK